MADIPDFVVLTVAGIFFVIAAVVGVCLYYHFFKTRNNSGQGRRETESFKHNCGIVNPFAFYMMGAGAPVELSGPPFTIEVNDEHKLASTCVLEEHHFKLPDKKPPVCRSIRYEKPLRCPCHLQVIQEMEEEEEETEEVNNDCKF